MGLAGVAGLALAATVCLSGCANLGYYWQSVTGHLKLVNAAKPVDEWLQEPETPQRIRDKLALAKRIRAYASSELKLPDNRSYHRYADLRRSAAVWNVTAAPAYSLELKTWCFPVTGCVGYRGYYDEQAARDEAAELTRQGYEAGAYPVTAYSTLGYLNWLGGDPLLNTFIVYPEGELARIIFHELAHQVVYAKNDTMFNESFATAVERLGGERWLATHADDTARREYAGFDARRRQFRDLSRTTRERLKAVYEATGVAPEDKQRRKSEVMAQFREEYAQMKARSGAEPAAWRGYDRWVANANNAFFGAQAAYDELVPAFEALFRRQGGDWQRFHDAVRQLAALPKEERHRQLKEAAVG
ncbi:aminopeptidase [Ramlibacter sp. PS3R-8]|uniref:aminopeptidase n=1 Tax=Ramlibacter sp. PS3R-8 TaxID=3133437 RepID=UPI0030A319F9